MKKLSVFLCAMLLIFGMVGGASATLVDFESVTLGDYTSLDFGDFTMWFKDANVNAIPDPDENIRRREITFSVDYWNK